MGKSTFTGPIMSGDIVNTSGTTLGRNVKNTGTVVLAQQYLLHQVAAEVATHIVLPAHSMIIDMFLFITVPWDGAATTVSVGTSADADELVVDGETVPHGLFRMAPGPVPARVSKWEDVGTTDVRIHFLSANAGAGTGRLIVVYAQAIPFS
jgi:hypothetical protein